MKRKRKKATMQDLANAGVTVLEHRRVKFAHNATGQVFRGTEYFVLEPTEQQKDCLATFRNIIFGTNPDGIHAGIVLFDKMIPQG